jgi:hypothetical protein
MDRTSVTLICIVVGAAFGIIGLFVLVRKRGQTTFKTPFGEINTDVASLGALAIGAALVYMSLKLYSDSQIDQLRSRLMEVTAERDRAAADLKAAIKPEVTIDGEVTFLGKPPDGSEQINVLIGSASLTEGDGKVHLVVPKFEGYTVGVLYRRGFRLGSVVSDGAGKLHFNCDIPEPSTPAATGGISRGRPPADKRTAPGRARDRPGTAVAAVGR